MSLSLGFNSGNLEQQLLKTLPWLQAVSCSVVLVNNGWQIARQFKKVKTDEDKS
ncbi:MAG: hypothetical protein F6K14_08540 [Symploca sp. SIO2C1]|nr:hypothetical protein [Symploca sp. SIO2C1]